MHTGNGNWKGRKQVFSKCILVFYSVLVEIPAALPLTLSITSTFPLEMSAFTMRL